jgi:hypothetical protein
VRIPGCPSHCLKNRLARSTILRATRTEACMAHKTTIFLASSSELKAERDAFELRINRKNKQWHEQGIFLHLVVWEDFIDAMSRTRKQDDYNAAIRAADLFVILVHTKVGKYSAEEFDAAHAQFKATGKPRIYTYFKNQPALGEPDPGPEYDTVRAFQAKLGTLGHFPPSYKTVDGLLDHFTQQLDMLRADGVIAGDAHDAAAALPSYQASNHGSGAIAQGAGAIAAGAGAVVIGGNVVVKRGDFVGRDKINKR